MKKISFFLALWSIVILSHSQTQRFEIDWNGSKVFSMGSKQIDSPILKQKFNFSFEKGISFVSQLDDKHPSI